MTVLSALWEEEIGEYFPGTFGTLVLDNLGRIVVSSTATTDTPIVNGGAEVLVFSGGTTVDAVVNGGGNEVVGSGGTAAGTIVNSGGSLGVDGGATVTGATINPGGEFGIYDGYSLADYTVNSNTLYVTSATATGTVVENGGYMVASVGGTVNATTLNGGTLALNSTATANGAITFEGTNNLLGIYGTTMGQVQTAVISGLAPGADTIWLPDVSYDSRGTATLQLNNLLQISENGNTFSLQLDPSQNFNGNVFALSPDPKGGTDIRVSSQSQLFTTGADKVDFNSLTSSQQAAVSSGADLYNALGGGDTITLPNANPGDTSVTLPGTTTSFDLTKTFVLGDKAGDVTSVTGGSGSYNIQAGDGNDTIIVGNGNNTINVGAHGANVTIGSGSNQIVSSAATSPANPLINATTVGFAGINLGSGVTFTHTAPSNPYAGGTYTNGSVALGGLHFTYQGGNNVNVSAGS